MELKNLTSSDCRWNVIDKGLTGSESRDTLLLLSQLSFLLWYYFFNPREKNNSNSNSKEVTTFEHIIFLNFTYSFLERGRDGGREGN